MDFKKEAIQDLLNDLFKSKTDKENKKYLMIMDHDNNTVYYIFFGNEDILRVVQYSVDFNKASNMHALNTNNYQEITIMKNTKNAWQVFLEDYDNQDKVIDYVSTVITNNSEKENLRKEKGTTYE